MNLKLTHGKILVFLLILFIVGQTFVVYFVFIERIKVLEQLADTENKLNEQINLNSKDVNSKINSILDSINSISKQQTNIQNELTEVKASASSDFSGIIERELKGVVTIKTDVSQGTGFIITDNGYVVTNAHVISGAHYANVFTSDNNQYASKLTGYNSNMDLALLKIEGSFSSLDLGNSNNVKIGEKVLAIGNPLGLSFTATEGIISARDREGINGLPYYFQTDVSLNPGNSGGPLINTNGKVIGINNFKISGADNIGFALEISYAKDTINEIALKALNQTIL